MQQNTGQSIDNNKAPTVLRVDIQKVIPNKDQPRKTFSQESLSELAESISVYGVLQPLLVSPTEDGRYMVIAGERRLRAAKLAHLTKIPVIITSYTDKQIAEIAMIENLQREDLHFIEEAEGYSNLMRNFNMTQQEVALRVGKKQSTIANKLRILRLPANLRPLLSNEKITERHARALLKLPDYQLQKQVLADVIEKELTVRQTESLIDMLLETKNAPETTEPPSTDVELEVGDDHNKDKEKLKAKSAKPAQFVIKDARIILNTVRKSVQDIQKMLGIDIKISEERKDEEIVLVISVPNKKSTKK